MPQAKTLYRYGPDGRYLLAGSWLFRYDRGVGLAQHFQRSRSRSGWKTVAVPNVWNAQDETTHSYTGTVAWYRKDFRLPSSSTALEWIVRFESVNYRARVWLNGHPIGNHAGAYLAFELRLPSHALSRTGVNHLVLRVDNRRAPGDIPPGGISDRGTLAGGWWNYGGLPREVYLRRVNGVDFEHVRVLPDLPCPTCPGRVIYRVTVHNYAHSTQTIKLASTFGSQPVDLGTVAVGGGSARSIATEISVPNPRLWTPQQPNLYDVNLTASVGGQQVAHYFLRSGIRSIQVAGGRLLLNGRPLNFRGVALHEDSPQFGSAISNTIRDQYIAWVKDIGATLIRAHYPLSPYLEEQADANGIMLWSEVPVYSVKEEKLLHSAVRRRGVDFLRNNILINGSHPSVIVWSVGNELSSRPGAGQRAYLAEAVSEAHALDPTRPVGMAILGYPTVGCQASSYRALQVIGINNYFGWYAGPSGTIADRDLLSDYIDQVRACYPDKALAITEFGAEANRPGPPEENGTYAFQQGFVNFMLNLFDTKPTLSGAIYFALQEFRVRPGWAGGDPRPNPPVHEKGLITFTGHPKPAYYDAKRIYHATTQLLPG
ncbi:MAG TPA: glycoside hydrolase family 2 TIM barrel-domain containing protein [Solirubrobacteraceae bacterium]|nr:glycoside hydrolase family 2 TIM barrel-domain containing protein [Solirubrobacteraceae bacterium]